MALPTRTNPQLSSFPIVRPGKDLGQRLAVLYDTHADEAVRFAYMLTGDLATAEDLVQDAFIRIFTRFADRKDPQAFGPYLHRTILNLARSQARRSRLERAWLQSTHSNEQSTSDSEADTPDVWAALLQLPLRQRTVVFLRYHVGLRDREIAETLGTSTGAVKSMMLRAKRRLRDALGEVRDGSA